MKQVTNMLFQTREKLSGILKVNVFTGELDNFDSDNGVLRHFKTIFKWSSLLLFVWFIYNIISAYSAFLSNGSHNIQEHISSVLTLLLCLYGANWITELIGKRGDSLGKGGNSILQFVFNDLGKMAIRLTGEIAVVSLLIYACCQTVATIFNCNAFFHQHTGSFTGSIFNFAGYLVGLCGSLISYGLNFLHLNVDFSGAMTLPSGPVTDSVSGQWTSQSVYDLLMSFIGVLLTLVSVHVILNVYGYLLSIVTAFTGWIKNPTLPVSVKGK